MPAPAQPGAEQVFPRPGDADFVRPLDIDVLAKETQTGRIMFGVGVNSDAGLVGNVTVDEQNFDWTRWPESFEDVRNATAFRGNGEHFRLELQPGTLVQRYTVSWAKPYVWDSEANLSLSGYYYNRIYNEWTEERVGGSIGLGYQLNHDLMAQVGFTAEAVGVSNPAVDSFIGAVPEPIADVVGFSTRLAFQQTIAHDTRDNQFLATEGHRFAVTFQEVVGTYDYPSVDVSFRQYFLLHQRADGSGRHTLTLGARFDVTADNTPVYDRFYAGGFATLRGFDFRGVSPVSPGGIHLGGDAMVLLSAEYLFPITADDTLRGVVFCDTGTVEPSLREWTDNYRIAPGAGLRISVPMMGPAPIALDLAFPVSVNPGDRVLNFSFNVGFQR
jgi:outer membrane protein insertion porin family